MANLDGFCASWAALVALIVFLVSCSLSWLCVMVKNTLSGPSFGSFRRYVVMSSFFRCYVNIMLILYLDRVSLVADCISSKPLQS